MRWYITGLMIVSPVQSPHQLHLVMMERFVWRILPILTFMGTISMEAEWKCAIMVPTVQSVARTGLTVMPELSVTTLVTVLIVSISMSLLDISQ